MVVIEINPRTSRSSALASKATGFPIAMVSSLLAGGLTLDEIPYWRDGTLEKYTPSGDYVVVKFARWAFEKFRGAEDRLGTQMRAVGEVMSIGKNYKEALQKAIRSLETGRHGLGLRQGLQHAARWRSCWPCWPSPPASGSSSCTRRCARAPPPRPSTPAPTSSPGSSSRCGSWCSWRRRSCAYRRQGRRGARAPTGSVLPDELLVRAKKDGFADAYLAKLLGVPEARIRAQRAGRWVSTHGYQPVPVSGVENAAYYYSTYNAPDAVPVSDRRKIMVLGGGPNRIGQGIEFDYCCVHAAFALREAGFESIMVNCNPETVSTDYDTSDKLYFEPLTVEDVLAIYDKERPEGVIVQFGGQTPLNIARELEAAGRADHRHLARHHRPGRGPRPLPRDDGAPRHPHARVRHGHHLWTRPWRSPSASATRSSSGPATCWAAGAWRSSTTRRCWSATWPRPWT